MQNRKLNRYVLLVAAGFAGSGATGAKAQTGVVAITDVQQYPSVAVVTGSLDGANYSASCGIVPTSKGQAARDKTLDSLSIFTTDYFRATRIGDSIVVVTPENGNMDGNSIVSVFSDAGKASVQRFKQSAQSAPYTVTGTGTPLAETSVSFEKANTLVRMANAVCDGAVAVYNKTSGFDTSPTAIEDHIAKTPDYKAQRSAYLAAVTR